MLGSNLTKELIAIVEPNGLYTLDWEDIPLKNDLPNEKFVGFQEEIYRIYNDDMYKALFKLGLSEQYINMSASLGFLYLISSIFIKKLSQNPDIENIKSKSSICIENDEISHLIEISPFIAGYEYLNAVWIHQVWDKLNIAFSEEIKNFSGSVSEYLLSINPKITIVGRVYFHLVESKEASFPFAFMATYSKTSNKTNTTHIPIKHALVEYGENSAKLLDLLSKVYKASEKSFFLAELLESGDLFHPIKLSASEAFTFLKEVSLYEESGILCRIPNWWKNKSNSLKVSINIGDKTKSGINLDSLVSFDAHLILGDDELSYEELKTLMSQVEGLAFIKGKWVEVNQEKLKETLLAFEKAQNLIKHDEMSIIEAMRLQLNAEKELNISKQFCEVEITNGKWLKETLSKLRRPETIDPISYGDEFYANLRPYQQFGLNWLSLMRKLNLGACLADDMGLGKTIQVIALLNNLRSNAHEKILLIIPATLIGNWINEIKKFAPYLKYYILHSSENKKLENINFDNLLNNYNLFITTYGMLLKFEWLKNESWDLIILDEAQAIKNPGTKQAKVVKQLKSSFRIAMTGTPIENHLSDLWSIFDFLNKGLLGTAKEFSTFSKKLKDDNAGYMRLKQVVSPFILRRLKTDKSIISDLPDKIEMKVYSTLTKKQIALYQSLVNELKIKLASTDEGIQRKGIVLASLMKFKQICNHPDQYLGQSNYAFDESGKYASLREICETICEKRERLLVFTQFKEIVEPLSQYLKDIFHHEGLSLHGETTISKRKTIVDKFQGHDYIPFLVLSIKAGGIGLNLTAANHVVHFDRWWNPAIENQATDRAFRIGQKKNVIVHKFITQGTIEEKIDQMITEKTRLSNEIMPDIQENWITELDNNELIDMFNLNL